MVVNSKGIPPQNARNNSGLGIIVSFAQVTTNKKKEKTQLDTLSPIIMVKWWKWQSIWKVTVVWPIFHWTLFMGGRVKGENTQLSSDQGPLVISWVI